MTGEGGDLESIKQQLLSQRGSAARALAGSYATGVQRKRGGADELTSLVTKRRADAIKISTINLRDNLVKELDKAMTEQLKEFPEMNGQYFIGFIMGETPSVEVVNIDDAAKAVHDMDEASAREVLSANPVGYFQPEDFQVETPEDSKYRSFQRRLNSYLERNSQVITYLQSHPEQIGSLHDLIKKP